MSGSWEGSATGVQGNPAAGTQGNQAAPGVGSGRPRRLRPGVSTRGGGRGGLRSIGSVFVREPRRVSSGRNATLRRLLAGADLISAALAFALAIPLLGHDALGLYTLAAIPTIVVVCKLSGLYDRDEYLLSKTTLDEAPNLFRVAALYTLLAFLAGDAMVDGHLGQAQGVALWGILFVSMVVLRSTARCIAGRVSSQERCLILANAEAAQWLSTKLERSHRTNVCVVGRIPLGPGDVSAGGGGVPRLGAFDALESLLDEHKIDRALIARGKGDIDHHVLRAIRVVKRLGVELSVLPRPFEVVGAAVEFDEVEGATLLGVKHHGLTRSSQILKRGFDLAGATLGLIVLAPLMAMIAIAIKLDSRGPVFFRQPRMGKDDETFRIYKFRTMVADADRQRAALAHRNEAGGGLFKIEDDPRITRVGSFLRRTSLDELAQLLNVVQGDMSLVGPRPLVLDEDCRIEGWERRRMLLPPGATGMWQILGSARIPMSEMVKIDYLYGANWSLWLDIKILLRTIPFVLGRRGL
jgi:exopolysaccharide biosynthesis polyprenyl glycosylphosphotransferase